MGTLAMSPGPRALPPAAVVADTILRVRNRNPSVTQTFETTPLSIPRARQLAAILRGCGVKAVARNGCVTVTAGDRSK